MVSKSVAFTGHRPCHFPFGYDEYHPACLQLKERLRAEIGALFAQGYTHFLSGMALGVDTWAAELVLELQKTCPVIRLTAVIPFSGQESRWPDGAKDRYQRILSEATATVVIEPGYTRHCMFTRNRYLVDHADLLIAVYDGSAGGTRYTVDYARKQNIPVRLIDPM